MGIGTADQPVEDERVQEPRHGVVRQRARKDLPQQVDDRPRGRPTLVLVLQLRRQTERLAEILLVDAPQPAVWAGDPVVALGNDGRLIVKGHDPGVCGHQSGAPSGAQAQVLVEVMVVEPLDGGLHDVTGGGRSAGYPPSAVRVQQSGLGLGAGQAEPATEARPQPRGPVPAQVAQPFGHSGIVQPLDVTFATQSRLQSVLGDEPGRARAVAAHRGPQQRERRAAHLEVPGPADQDAVVVGQ